MNLTDPTTLQGLYEDVKFKSGQDSLGFADFVRMANIATSDYARVRVTANGRWKFDDTTHVNGDGEYTSPVATATLAAGEDIIELDADFLTIEQVLAGGEIVHPISDQDYQDFTAAEVYGTGSKPRAYSYVGNTFRFYPSADTAYTITVLFTRASPEFSATDTDAVLGIPRADIKYLSLNIRDQLNERTTDPNAANITNKLAAEEARIRDFASKQDQDSPRRLKAKINVPN